MNFGVAPLVAAALLGLAAIVVWVLYRVRPEPQPVTVPSNFIWRRVLDERRRREDFWRWLISLAAALLVALSVALALARPSFGDREVRRLALVLDNSPALAALGADGASRWERAVAEAERRIAAAGANGEFLVLDTAGRRGGRSFLDSRAARAALESLSPVFGAEHRFPEVSDLLAADSAAEGAEVVFFGDGVAVSGAPPGVERVSVFEPAVNAGITAFDVRPLPRDPGRFEAYVEVVLHGESPEAGAGAGVVALQIDGAGGATLRRVLRVRPGAPSGETVPLAGFVAGPVRAAIAVSGGDAFPADDVAHSYVPSRNRLRVLLAAEVNPYWEAALRLDPRVTLESILPGELAARGAEGVDVIVLDGPPPEALPAAPLLFAGAGEADWLPPRVAGASAPEAEEAAPESGAEPEDAPEAAAAVLLPVMPGAENHPVLDGLHLDDALAREVRAFSAESLARFGEAEDAGARWTALLGDSRLGLLAARSSPRRALAFAFPLRRSNLALQPDFPVLLSRSLSWLTDVEVRRAGLGPVRVRLGAGTIFDAEGEEMESQQLGGELSFEAGSPSLYYASGAGREIVIAANLLDRRVSDLNRSAWAAAEPAARASAGAEEEPPVFPVLWPYLALFALLLLVAEWFAFHRQVTV